MEITKADLNGPAAPGMAFGQVKDPTRLKFEMVNNVAEVKVKTSFFGSLLKGLAAFAPLAYVMGPFTGGIGFAAGAALGGGGILGNHLANKASRETAAEAASLPKGMSYPGLSPAVFASDPSLDLISARDGAMIDSIHGR